MQLHDDLRPQGFRNIQGILPALIVIGVGVVFLLNNLNIPYLHDFWRFWPVLLIAAGLAKMVDATFASGRFVGGILIGVGALFLGDSLGYLQLTWNDFWPVVLIVAGLLMLWHRAFPPPGRPANSAATREGMLNEYAIFGGVDRKLSTDDFRGGTISAMFGGVVIDLRRAGMRADSAVIDTASIFGGVDLKIPPNWIVISQVIAIFGGFANKSVEPNADMPGVKRLYIRGAAVFGGVSVKN
jgi:hypothetical protein